MTPEASDAAACFHRLHHSGLLLLANAWDAGSARLIESLGAKAVATTSAGVAWAHGYQDGSQLPVQRLVDTVAAIARVVTVPISVDIEDGYATEPTAVAANVARVLDAGAVGINLEDGTDDPAVLCAKIEQAKRVAHQRGIELFVNARTDVHLRRLVPEDRLVDETLARARRYHDAGADGLFVPGLVDPAAIRAITAAMPLPLNVMARPALPPAAELEALGVRRLSAGSDIAQAMFARAAALSAGFLRTGDCAPLFEEAWGYGAINALFERT